MPTTTNLGLPYPSASDTADVPRDVRALADRLDIVIPGALVTSLPGSPADGQEVYYVANAAQGIVWHLRYRAAAAGPYKWEMAGGSRLYAFLAAAETTGNPAYADLPTVGPQVTVPLAGDYDIYLGCQLSPPASVLAAVGPSIGGAITDDDSVVGTAPQSYPSRTIRRTVASAGAVVKLMYKSGGGISQFQRREVAALPVRVG